jgi:hypothetical protein
MCIRRYDYNISYLPPFHRYTRHEVQTRYIFYSLFLTQTIISFLSCLLAWLLSISSAFLLVALAPSLHTFWHYLEVGTESQVGHGFSWVSYIHSNLYSITQWSCTYTKIIEGAITIGFGIIAWFFLPNFPDQNVFLTREETRLVLQRVEHDRGDSVPDVLTKGKLFSHLLDWKVWTFGMKFFWFVLIGFFNHPLSPPFPRCYVHVRDHACL